MKKLLFLVLFAPALLNGAANDDDNNNNNNNNNLVQQVLQGLQNNFNGIANMQNDQRRQAYQNLRDQAQGFLNQQNQNLSNQQKNAVKIIIQRAALRARANPQNLFAQGALGVADVQMPDANDDPMDVVVMDDDGE